MAIWVVAVLITTTTKRRRYDGHLNLVFQLAKYDWINNNVLHVFGAEIRVEMCAGKRSR